MKMIFKYGVRDGLEPDNNSILDNIQCFDCKRWFESESFRSSHTCITAAAAAAHSNRWLQREWIN